MTIVKGSALVLGFAGAVALGVWVGPHITHRGPAVADQTVSTQAPAPNAGNGVTATAGSHPASSPHVSARVKKPAATTTAKRMPVGATPRQISVIAPALHERLKPLLNKGADMGIASEDFGDAEQLAEVAHAARNTQIPFMVLKERVVYQTRSLENAIQEFKPDLNAAAEAHRARTQAKADISALEG